jgi:subtilisin family serine protease
VRRALPIALVAALCAAASAAGAPGGWWLHDVGADQASPPGPGVPVAVLDSGVDPTLPLFAGRPNTTFLNDQTVDGVEEWHGSAVASVVLSVYPQAALEIWDVSAAPGQFSDVNVVSGLDTVAQHCPAVINLSFGSPSADPALDDAIATAIHNGCLVVAAAGNDGTSGRRTFPAAELHVLAVGASDESDHVAGFSSIGPWLDVVAPGVDIGGAVPLSHDPSGYSNTLQGTSFATPIVSATAAWLWTLRPTLDALQIAELLRDSARDVGAPGFDFASGWGALDLPAALTAPVPARDPEEPNDDIDQVKPGALFALGEPALTTAARASNRIAGSLDAYKDLRDLYRIWVPAHRVVRVSVPGGDAAARIWGPQTTSVAEDLAQRRRDLKGTSVRAGAAGFAAYVEVLLTGRTRGARYVLSVQSSTR